MACINIKHPEYINLVSRLSEFGITNPVDIQGKIHEYQEETNTDLFPGLDYFNIEDEVVNDVLEKRQNKVQANQQQLSVIQPNKTINNLFKEFEKTNFKSNETIDIIYNNANVGTITLTESVDKSTVQITGINIKEEFRRKGITEKLYKILPYKYNNVYSDFERVNPAIDKLYEKLVQQGYADKIEENNMTAYKLKKNTVVKEGVDFVFEQNPELASIGTQEQYSQYLSTIFKTSKVKDIVYHNTDEQFDRFRTTPVAKFFTKSLLAGKKYRLPVILNISNPRVFSEFTEDDEMTYGLAETYAKNKEKDGIVNGTEGKTRTEYIVFEPEQIHILSSKKDLEMFRNFINFTKSEYAKYGDIQQFRDYIMSKNFAAIEEFLVVNNKIDRKC